MPQQTVGILGGGQLGRMLAHPAALMGIPLLILDSGPDTPAKQVSLPPHGHTQHPDGAFTSPEHIKELARNADVLTVEIEHVDADVLAQVEADGLCAVQPAPGTIKLIQDKYLQKRHLEARGIAVAPFAAVPERPTLADWQALERELGLPLMVKSRTMAYDGKGNSPLKTLEEVDIGQTMDTLVRGAGGNKLYAEAWAPFVMEVAVMVVRNVQGQVKSYDAVETIHKDSILRVCFAPLRVAAGGKGMSEVNRRAKELAESAVATLDGAGIFGVEMFLMPDGTFPGLSSKTPDLTLTPFPPPPPTASGSLMINEIAPRPHNSGHHTIEACETSQFENHLRAILSLPLGSTSLRVPAAAMLNMIGTSESMQPIEDACTAAYGVPGATVHLYGKKECRKGRKMGHVTVTGSSDAQVRERIRPILAAMPDLAASFIDALCTPPRPAATAAAAGTTTSGFSHPQPLVGIIMGSDSDLPTLLPAARILDTFKIPYELTICSAHRTPARMVTYAKEAAGRGLRCIIAGAGGAAHLPGMVASETTLPVVGVPVKGSVLDGVDSLYSIVQMPRGIPVATVGIANATNAALLAIRIIGSATPETAADLAAYARDLENEVLHKVDKMEEIGWEAYAKQVLKK
ncbi:phosphoribosylaminoimidazole carboxylase ade2 [Naganishia friedmannii]|uniref:Phosphoribosylaminoimidazole carboxylase ade2 n=1 Tax=Naganishia friedmannii TaxID=89922 RepID=A0ACC2VE67_9TREE|nr:phosphoribosylaminoimidazole carboxylase ade2 [Naganishia friedmannii]